MCPVYTYYCTCKEWDEVYKVDDRDNIVGVVCPNCEGKVERLIVPTTFILKGSCWEKDNYSRNLGDAVKNGGTFKSE